MHLAPGAPGGRCRLCPVQVLGRRHGAGPSSRASLRVRACSYSYRHRKALPGSLSSAAGTSRQEATVDRRPVARNLHVEQPMYVSKYMLEYEGIEVTAASHDSDNSLPRASSTLAGQ